MELLNFNYKNLSEDYEKLFELMQKERIICFVENSNGNQDICATMAVIQDDYYRVGARGIEYIGAFKYKDMTAKEDFINQCKNCKLKFLEP